MSLLTFKGFKSIYLSLLENKNIEFLIFIMIAIPFYIQIDEGIFINRDLTYQFNGNLLLTPLPISLLVSFMGFLTLVDWKSFKLGAMFVLSTFFLITLSLVLNYQNGVFYKQKIILTLQTIAPMTAFLLGYRFVYRDRSIEKSFLIILTLFVPFQLICTWMQGMFYLTPWLLFMSIYQHLQYVPIVFASIFLIAINGLWDQINYRYCLIILTLFMSIYIVASLSFLTMIMFYVGMIVFILFKITAKKTRWFFVGYLLLCLMISSFYFLNLVRPQMAEKLMFLQSNSILVQNSKSKEPIVSIEIKPEASLTHSNINEIEPIKKIRSNFFPSNLVARINYWSDYSSQIFESKGSFLFGHPNQPDRKLYPSAHNYYLDFVYNFGFVAISPLFVLIFITIRRCCFFILRYKHLLENNNSFLVMLIFIIIFVLLIDNMFKVSLRQPYSGIFTFFLWGFLIRNLTFKNLKIPF